MPSMLFSGAINPVRNPNTPSTFFQPMAFYWSSSVISNGVKEFLPPFLSLEGRGER
jgi:hypothetical protein